MGSRRVAYIFAHLDFCPYIFMNIVSVNMFIRDLKLNYKGMKLKLNYERQTFEAEIED